MGFFDSTIALSPANNSGICVSYDALHAADIVVCTTTRMSSAAIRVITQSVASHAALYEGGGTVIEAVVSGVLRHTVAQALSDDALAAAYRHRAMTINIAEKSNFICCGASR